MFWHKRWKHGSGKSQHGCSAQHGCPTTPLLLRHDFSVIWYNELEMLKDMKKLKNEDSKVGGVANLLLRVGAMFVW